MHQFYEVMNVLKFLGKTMHLCKILFYSEIPKMQNTDSKLFSKVYFLKKF